MKKFSFAILILFLGASLNSALANVVITGITNPTEMNGIYVEQQGDYGGKPFYEHIDNSNYCIYYEPGGMGGQWIISQIPGPWTSTMSIFAEYFYIITSGTENVPPTTGYSIPLSMSMPIDPLAGNPEVLDSPVIPVSMWAIVFMFFIVGTFIVYRSYKKRQIA